MKKNLYSLFVLGAMLFWGACSDNDTSVAGSTEDTNMRTPSGEDGQSCGTARYHVEIVDGDTIIVVAEAKCYKIQQDPLNPEDVPDSCKVAETLDARSFNAMDYTWDADEIADAEWREKLDSLSLDETIDEATRSCAQRYSKTKPLIKDFHTFNYRYFFIKSFRCNSDQVYYTKGYKDLLQELGIKNDKDSVEVSTVAKNLYLQEAEKYLDACVEALKTRENVIWDASTSNLKTGVDSLKGTFIGFYENDSAYGGNSHFEWNNEDDKLSGKAVFTKNEGDVDAYVSLGIWLDGKTGKKGHSVFDVSDKEGVCFMHYADGVVKVMLDMGDSLNAVVNDTLYAVELTPRAAPNCVSWDDFEIPWYGPQIDRETALKHLAGFRYEFSSNLQFSTSSFPRPFEFEIEKVYFIEP